MSNTTAPLSYEALAASAGLAYADDRISLAPVRAGFAASYLRRQGLDARIEGAELVLPAQTPAAVTALRTLLCPTLLCWDVDGCLIDTRASFDQVVKTLVARYLGREPEDAELLAVRREGGFNDDNLLAYELIKRNGVAVVLDDIFPAFRDLYLGTDGTPGLYRLETPILSAGLSARMRGRFDVALVTGRNREELGPALELLNLPPDMPAWTVDDVAAGKPDPEGILAAAARFGADAYWMVGDNVDDILAARAAGAAAVGVGRYREALLDAGADVVLESIEELEVLL